MQFWCINNITDTNAVELLKRDEMLRIRLSVVEDNEDRRTCFIVDHRVISTRRGAGVRSLRRRHNHRLSTSYELARQHQRLVDVLGARGIWRRVGGMGRVREITREVDASTKGCRYTSTTHASAQLNTASLHSTSYMTIQFSFTLFQNCQ